MKSFILRVAVILLCVVCNIKGLNLESAKEQPCFKIEKTLSLGPALSPPPGFELPTMYYPHMSRIDLYMNAEDILRKDASEISESSLYYDSCMVFKKNNGTYLFSEGFGGHTREYLAKKEITNDNVEATKFHTLDGKGVTGTSHLTFTDYKTFFFSAFCIEDGQEGQMSWGVASFIPKLPEESVKLIHEHALSLGFKKEYFEELRYDQCKFEEITHEEL